jgi:hypothetical protein
MGRAAEILFCFISQFCPKASAEACSCSSAVAAVTHVPKTQKNFFSLAKELDKQAFVVQRM